LKLNFVIWGILFRRALASGLSSGYHYVCAELHQYSFVFWLIWVFPNYLCCGCGLSRGFGILEISQDCSSGWRNRLTKASIVLAGLPLS
jgi:hypothetical protein